MSIANPPFSGQPAPVAGVTGGPTLVPGQVSLDTGTGNLVVHPDNNVTQYRKGAVPQALQVYESFTSNTVYRRIALNTNTNGPFQLRVEMNPTNFESLDIDNAANGLVQIWGQSIRFGRAVGATDWLLRSDGNFAPLSAAVSDLGVQFVPVRTAYVEYVNFNSATVTGYTGPGCTMFSGTGAPAVALGTNGDYYWRVDTPAVANQRMYVKSAGAWIGIV